MTVLRSRRSRGWVARGLKGPSGMVKGRGQEWAGAAPALVEGTREPPSQGRLLQGPQLALGTRSVSSH